MNKKDLQVEDLKALQRRNPYQRGNRDALLWMAAAAKARANIYREEIDRCTAVMLEPVNSIQRNAAKNLHLSSMWRMQAWEEAAALAERMSESIPEDPENFEETI